MGRQVHSGHRQAEPFGQRKVEDRQADRDPLAAVDHLIQIAIPGVVIILDVAAIALLDEEDPVDLAEDLAGTGPFGASIADPSRQGVDPGEIVVRIEPGIGVAGQFQGQPGEVGVVVPGDQASEFGAGFERRAQETSIPGDPR